MKKLLALALLLISSAAIANGGWTSTGTNDGSVKFIEVVRAQGFLIKGNFGNPAECSAPDYLWIDIAHPQYDQLY